MGEACKLRVGEASKMAMGSENTVYLASLPKWADLSRCSLVVR